MGASSELRPAQKTSAGADGRTDSRKVRHETARKYYSKVLHKTSHKFLLFSACKGIDTEVNLMQTLKRFGR